MTTQQAITKCFGAWRDYLGRASKSEFWQFFLFVTVLQMTVQRLESWLSDFLAIQLHVFGPVALVLTYPPLVAAAVRRTHDIGLSGWAFATGLVLACTSLFSDTLTLPIGMAAGWLALLICGAMLFMLMLPGQNRPNKFGPNPVEVTP
ncbi:MAG: hypothetical protein CSA68_03950 [Rhodobacterales bacterium]|nr:MAG: hypothetical protein CSA68_03950 [Rhodobacterales bacterium]